MNWLKAHWEIKVLALIMAIVLYFYTANQARTDKDLVITLDVAHVVAVPDDRVVTEISPREISITLNGPLSKLADLDENQIRPRVVFEEARVREDGTMAYDLTIGLLQLDPSLRLSESSKDSVTVSVDRRVDLTFPVQIGVQDVELDVPGLVVASAKSDISQVIVRGPEKLIGDQLEGSLPLKKIRLVSVPEDMAGETVFEGVPLEIDLPPRLAGQVQVLGAERLTAAVSIAPAPGERPFSLPLVFLVPEEFFSEYEIEVRDAQVPINIRGPKNLLKDLQPEDLTAYVKLPAQPDLDIDKPYPVRIIGPAYARPEASTVDVKVTLRAKVPDDSGDMGDIDGEEPPEP